MFGKKNRKLIETSDVRLSVSLTGYQDKEMNLRDLGSNEWLRLVRVKSHTQLSTKATPC